MAKPNKLDCFKAYDIRGKVPEELNENLAYRIGQAYSEIFSPRKIAIGHDIRLSSPSLAKALAEGFMASGVNVIDLGLCGTEEIYFAAFNLEVDGGIIVTASHNPANYNGMKFVRKGAIPISGDSGLREIERLASGHNFTQSATPGRKQSINNRAAYIDHLLQYIDREKLKPLKIVVNAGNGGAGQIIDLLEESLPFTLIKILHEPDGSFPNGVPNPLLPENRALTSHAVLENQADLGIAWDGDFDRCFLFDEKGRFIEGYYMVGLLARAILKKSPGLKIIHDPRLIWNTREIVTRAGGTPIMTKTGHAFIKERMRSEDAVYGGEMSAHHYFKEFAYCDSGMIPWLLVTGILSDSDLPLSAMVNGMIEQFPVSGEINRRVTDPDAVISKIEDIYQDGQRDYTDGFSFATNDYRFNIRKSNTEPVLRLNVETRGNCQLLAEKTEELLALLL
ncbi:MAG: phosphomannomutase [Proteobacteria bacterium]|nr:phosphomannomutase [Pseudomonadota bacterium]MBU1715524.1 phosphomannomutase [Pseudomonadota bacterium]